MSGPDYVRILFRLPTSLHEALKRWAAASRRSVTAEMIYRLERSIRADDRKERRDS